MKKRLVSVFLVCLCVFALFPTVSATATVPCMTIDSKLLMIGDSNTVALRNYNTDLYPATIYARINGRIEECVENWSRYPADRYTKCIYQLLKELSGNQFRTVVINMGTNNIGGSTTKFRTKYRELMETLYTKNPNAVIYVCKILPTNPNHCSGEYRQLYTPANVKRINDEVAGIQQEFAALGYQARLLDLNTPFSDANGVLLSKYDSGGGVHLNANGYKKMNQVIQTVLAQGDPEANHTWDDGVTTLPPTCGSDGFYTYTCTVCGGTKNLVIPASNAHQWNHTWVSVSPTCVKEGTRVYQCTLCGQERYEAIPATGVHTWGIEIMLSTPTCTESGRCRYICTQCGKAKEQQPAALGHAWMFPEILSEGVKTGHGGLGRYTCSRCQAVKVARLCAREVFVDMPSAKNWAHAPIDWAYFSGITSGRTENTFDPQGTCTRAEVITFLWCAAGRPEPKTTQNPFTDVSPKRYYYKAALWAVEQGITAGKTETTFAPKAICTRAETLCFLWCAAGKPEPSVSTCPFTDVSPKKYYYLPVLWASSIGITAGTTPTTFSPKKVCTRAQVITFLYKASMLNAEEPQP